MINIVVYNVANPLQLPYKLASYVQIVTLHTFIHHYTHYSTTYTIHTCDIHTVHELHTPSQQPVDDALMSMV